MAQSRKITILIFGLALFVFCLIGIGGTYLILWQNATSEPTPLPLVFPTRPPASPSPQPESSFEKPTPSPVITTGGGKIVYVCQIFRVTDSDQICIMNADGTDQRRLTTSDKARYFYPSFSPDGQSIVFSSNADGQFEIYELKLSGELTRTWQPGIAPEISPDGRSIAFVQNNGISDAIWLMDRDGKNPRLVSENGWDPTWSPDGKRILFASLVDNLTQLMTINLDGTDLRRMTDLPFLRGRSDWSDDGLHIITYNGRPWERELYLMSSDGSNPRQITPTGGNSQGPSFSPDGQWVTFTAYYDQFRKVHGCEIYKMRIDGSELTRLTDNDYCDWQPRWGP